MLNVFLSFLDEHLGSNGTFVENHILMMKAQKDGIKLNDKGK